MKAPIDSERISRGRRAAGELEETAAAFGKIRGALIEALIAADDAAEILNLHGKLRGIEFVKAELKSAVIAGQAEEQLAAQDD